MLFFRGLLGSRCGSLNVCAARSCVRGFAVALHVARGCCVTVGGCIGVCAHGGAGRARLSGATECVWAGGHPHRVCPGLAFLHCAGQCSARSGRARRLRVWRRSLGADPNPVCADPKRTEPTPHPVCADPERFEPTSIRKTDRNRKRYIYIYYIGFPFFSVFLTDPTWQAGVRFVFWDQLEHFAPGLAGGLFNSGSGGAHPFSGCSV